MATRITDSLPFSSSQTVSWIHIGDLHMTRAGEKNEVDLGRIVDEINQVYARGGVDFVFIPGDIADDGSTVAYDAVRSHLDRLKLPWCGIVGDHDVHEENFNNFQNYISESLFSRFSIGPYRFYRLNAFATPKPDSFELGQDQLRWLEKELDLCEHAGEKAVLLLHCYPSDLKKDRKELKNLLQKYPVLLIDMGHTHYNEISNDGLMLYSATRSTGQIEEGPVGYSVTTLDHGVVSWHFVELDSPNLVAITQPADERLITRRIAEAPTPKELCVRAKCWSLDEVQDVSASIGNIQKGLQRVDGQLWEETLDVAKLPDGVHDLKVTASSSRGQEVSTVRVRIGSPVSRHFSEVDQENSIGKWEDRGLLGTQLGPNKNGRKW